MSTSESTVSLIVTLVHGTWGRRSSWTMPGSLITRKLLSKFGKGTVVKRYEWSGANSLCERIKAASALRSHLKDGSREHRAAKQIVIGHSHGGMVLLYSLKDADVRQIVQGGVCMSTPFLFLRKRKFHGGMTTYALACFALIAIVFYPLLKWLVPTITVSNQAELFLIGLLPTMFIIGVYLMKEVSREEYYSLPTLIGSRLLIIRPPLDEATGILIWSQFTSWVVNHVWSAVHDPVDRVAEVFLKEGEVLTWSEQAWFTIRIMIAGGIGLLTWDGTLSKWCGAYWTVLKYPAWTLVVMLGCYYSIVLLRVILGVVLAPLAMATFLFSIPFGIRNAITSVIYESSAEFAPPGKWDVLQMPPRDRQQGGKRLMHSTPYDDEVVVDEICNWMETVLS